MPPASPPPKRLIGPPTKEEPHPFEIGLLRQRAREAFEQKIQRGHALWELPVGFVRTEEDLVEKIADRQVQEAIASVFRKFREFGSARQTTLWYHEQHIPLPTVLPGTCCNRPP